MRNQNFIMVLFTCCVGLIAFSAFSTTIYQQRSLYRNIEVNDQGDLRCLKFQTKQRQSQQSCFLKSDPKKLVFNYTQLLLSSLLLNANPEKILIIGLGGGTLSNTLHDLLPDSQIDNVELDPAVITVARKYFHYFENSQINSVIQDGRLFVKRALHQKKQYDLIILDAFNGDYIPEHLLTVEFLTECKQLLTKQGVLAANTFSQSDLYNHESATYQAVFGDFFNVKNSESGNRIILASQQLPKRSAIIQQVPHWQKAFLSIGADAEKLADKIVINKDWPANTRLLTDQYSPANLLNSK
jgi:spermidine synthase